MKLSMHFSLEEFTLSQTAARKKINNEPTPTIIEHLRKTAAGIEMVRGMLGSRPVFISSGYRSPDLNVAIGGSPTSAHPDGWAADFTCPGYGSPREVWEHLKHEAAHLNFDQLILEFDRWVHCSFDPRARQQAFVIE